MKSELRAHAPWPINFYVEYLETQRFSDKGYEEGVFQSVLHTYAGLKMDLLMVQSYPALEFVLEHRDKLFSGVPIVFWRVDRARIPQQKLWPGITGVTEDTDVRGTVELALRLHPRTDTAAVITGNSEFDTYWLGIVHAELLRYQTKVKEIDLVGLPQGQLLERVAELPPQTVVLFQQLPQDSIQPAMGAYDLVDWIGQRLPTYCIFSVLCLNHGGIGGVSPDVVQEEIPLTAAIARRVLSGERAETIPVVNEGGTHPMVDWRQLRHWKIPESALPSGTLVLYREPTVWERDRKYFLAAITIVVVQTLLIFGLLWQRARRRKAQAVLRESEKRFRVMADTAPSLIWMCDQEGNVTYLNDRRVAFTGSDPTLDYGPAWTAYVHADDLKNVLDVLSQSLKTHQAFSTEYRLRRRDGVYRWMFDVAAPRVDGDRSFAGFIGSAVDITDQRKAQETLENLSGQLIAAQEKERSHLARELHDDICQRLAMLSIGIQKITKGWGSGRAPSGNQLEQIGEQCSTLAHDVQALSHELHPSTLDYCGLVTAVRGFCREVSGQSGTVVEFTDNNIPTSLPREVSLSLFRVIQEALHNSIKYSGEKHFEVHLQGKAEGIELEVSDRGVGFNMDGMKNGKGLGLVSMSERIHLVNGRLTIDSKPNVGTTIRACVPLATHSSGSLVMSAQQERAV